ncbi:plant invertase/pectin methylesterase inhibitor [Striga asiatica]|uniref:Plant invertase/pectin methylesterase inhibitor n=1 Tax=Striga asiatica TaxID=4170 RepID=A0A5A7NY45_STRAF|nr:plant invertase/pectin methylesterase inhibitor [Striga asiatica]
MLDWLSDLSRRRSTRVCSAGVLATVGADRCRQPPSTTTGKPPPPSIVTEIHPESSRAQPRALPAIAQSRISRTDPSCEHRDAVPIALLVPSDDPPPSAHVSRARQSSLGQDSSRAQEICPAHTCDATRYPPNPHRPRTPVHSARSCSFATCCFARHVPTRPASIRDIRYMNLTRKIKENALDYLFFIVEA